MVETDTEIDPSKTVIELKEADRMLFLPTDNPQDFIVINGRVFARDYYGSVEVYSLTGKQKVSSIRFTQAHDRVRKMATDGSHIYFQLTGDFEIEEKDLMWLKEGKRGEEENEECRYHVEYSGEEIGSSGRSREKGIGGRIVSIPLQKISRGYIWSPSLATEDQTRLLIPKEYEPYTNISSQGDFASVRYYANDWMVETFLRRGKVVEKPSEPQEPKSILGGLSITPSNNHPGGIEAVLYEPEEKWESWDRPKGHGLQVVFSNGIPNRPSKVVGVQRNGTTLYVLHELDGSDLDRKGIEYVNDPASLITYEISLKELIDRHT